MDTRNRCSHLVHVCNLHCRPTPPSETCRYDYPVPRAMDKQEIKEIIQSFK